MGDQSNGDRKRLKPGILRLDLSKPRRSSGGSVEFKMQPELLGEAPPSISPASTGATSPPQLSVTWASFCDGEVLDPRVDSNKTKMSQMHSQLKASLDIVKKLQSFEEAIQEANTDPSTPVEGEHNSEDEDYSMSVSAIMQRRASVRGNRRKSFRNSSPMDALTSIDRRRSSVFTTSSGDTAISLEDGPNQDSTQEQIFENIRLHKEVLQAVKYQPWSIKRKSRLVRQAKAYVAKHQGVLQERFAMSRSTKDLWARFKIMMTVKWQHWRRELRDFSALLIPWELQIKEIESHFGSVVASYFTFLRWLLWVNIIITALLSSFVIIPEWMGMGVNHKIQDNRKKILKGELKVAGNFMTIWEFNGYLKYSPLFYGYYSNYSGAARWGYNLPLAYFLTSLVVYIYSFVATLRKMAENSRSSKLSSKDDECVFSWKLFTGWDFMIGHAETAHNRVASVVLGFKEALLEEAEKKKDKRNWKVILMRIFVNLAVIGLLAASAYTIVIVVDRSENVDDNASWWRRNEITVFINVISLVLPMIFDVLGFLESCHPREQLRLQLARIMILNLLNLYSMIFALFFKITEKTDRLEKLRETIKKAKAEQISLKFMKRVLQMTTPIPMNLIGYSSNSTKPAQLLGHEPANGGFLTDFTTIATEIGTKCFSIPVNCSKPKNSSNKTLTTSLLLLNLTTTLLPDIWQNFSQTQGTDMTLSYFDNATNFTSTTASEFYSDYYEYDENNYTDELSAEKERSERRRRIVVPEYQGSSIYDQLLDVYLNIANHVGYKDHMTEINASETPESITELFQSTLSTFIDNVTTSSPYEDDWDNVTRTTYETTLRNTVYDFIANVTDESITPDMFESDFQNSGEAEENCTEVIVCVPWDDRTTEPDSFYTSTEPSSPDGENSTLLIKFDTTETTSASTAISETTFTTNPTVAVTTPMTEEVLNETIRNVSKIILDARKALTGLCWETMLGQEMAKILVSDLVTVIGMSLVQDFFRALFVRYMNRCWIWDLEKKFPQYGDFKVAENVLQLVCNQGQVWMGIFFSPGLAILNLAKLIILMYIRLWIIFTCNVPHEVVFRATRSNNFYLSLLLTMLFLCVLPVGYAIVWLTPSWHCGPFSKYSRISEFFTNTTRNALPKTLHKPLEYITSSSTVIPLLLLLILIIYYLVSLTGALREANQDLKDQLQKERAEERKKMCKVNAEKAAETGNSITSRWKRVLEASSPLTPTGPGISPEAEESKIQARKELLARIMKKALRKESATSDDESIAHQHGNDGDETDTEHHDSLPHDEELNKNASSAKKSPSEPRKRTRKPSLIDIVQLARRDSMNEPHPHGRFKINQNLVEGKENDAEVNSRVVFERRKSLLKRQKQLHRCDSISLPEKDDPNINYQIVNEKNKQVEKKSKQKHTPKSEAEVFKFDEHAGEKSQDRDRKDGDNKKKVSLPEKEKSHKHHTKKQDHPIEPEPKSPAPSKGRRKFGSFLALVKEAVIVKRQEVEKPDECDTPDIPSPFSTFEEPVDEDLKEDDTRPGGTMVRSESINRKVRREAATKRQDSQGSVWSDNIPVITISKSGSDECILEYSDREADTPKPKVEDQ